MTIKRVVHAGRTIEIDQYHVNHIPRGPRKKKTKETPERIRKANLRRRTDKLRQLMNANFNDQDFWSMTLTYKEVPESIREVREDASDFVRRLRKVAKVFGVELKFIYAIGAGPHRRHIHITINALPDMAIFSGCWVHGHVSMTKLYTDGQYRDLADYYIKNAIETKEQEEELGEPVGQMYVCSRNLIRPIVEKFVIHGRFKNEPDRIPGYYLEKDSVYTGITSMGFPLLRYTLLQEKRYAGNKDIHIHGRSGQRREAGGNEIPAPVHPGRQGDRKQTGKGAGDSHHQSERRNTRDHDHGDRQDRRRKQDTRHDNMPLLGRLHGSGKPGLLQKMVSECLAKLKRN